MRSSDKFCTFFFVEITSETNPTTYMSGNTDHFLINLKFYSFQGLISTSSTNQPTTSLLTGYFPAESSSTSFVPQSCPSQYAMGLNCNTSSTPCDILKPCQNNGNCTNNNNTLYNYICLCPPSFDGTECQIDNRPCKPNTCQNNGILFVYYII